jgi:hypothetical protein
LTKSAAKFGYDTVLLANSSCPPLSGFKWGKNDAEKELCVEKIKQIFEFVSKNERIEKIVFATRGPVYIHGEIEGKASEITVNESLNTYVDSEFRTYQEYAKGYETSLDLLSQLANVKNIYYFLENPELDFLPKELVPRPFDYFGISIKSNYVRRDLYRIRMQKYRELVTAVSGRSPKTTVVDVEPYLCNRNQCLSYINGNFLYADDDHFSVFGSNYIAEKTEHILF